jgi:hypothetical protein
MSSTPIVPTWQAEFDSRIAAFSEAIGVEKAKVREVLADYGADGKSAQSLQVIDSEKTLPMNELFTMFVDNGLTQRGRMRLAADHLWGKTSFEEPATSEESSSGVLGSVVGVIRDMTAGMRPKTDWSDRELLEAYDETSNEIWEILRKRSHGRPFIVNLPDNSGISIDESLKLLKIAKKQPTSNKHKIGGKLLHVFRAGEFLTTTVDESPFCRGVALVGDYCSQSDTNWEGVCHEARVICRLHVDKVESAALSKREMKQVAKIAKNLEELRDELSDAALMHDELKVQDERQLPSLKINPDKTCPQSFHGKTDNAF